MPRDFRHISDHIVTLQPRRLTEFEQSFELVCVMRDALYAHKGYYEAGFIHGDVSEANIMIFNGRKEDGKEMRKGVLLDLDKSYTFERYVREAKKKDALDKGKGKEKAAAPSEDVEMS